MTEAQEIVFGGWTAPEKKTSPARRLWRVTGKEGRNRNPTMKTITHHLLLTALVSALSAVLPATACAATTSNAEIRAAGTSFDLLAPAAPSEPAGRRCGPRLRLGSRYAAGSVRGPGRFCFHSPSGPART
jgi:hypothetical protein